MKIRPISRLEEKKVLTSVLYHLSEHPPNGIIARFKREILAFAVMLLILLLVLCLMSDPTELTFVVTGAALALGLAVGIGVNRLTAAVQWPAIARCIDRSKVEARLRELDA